MATIHPSRMGLVPQDPPKDVYAQTRDRRRSPSPRAPRRRSPPPHLSRDKDRHDRRDHRDDDRDRDRRRDSEAGKRAERGRARADDYFDEASSGGEGRAPPKRARSRSVDKERDREREERGEREKERDRPRRRSPEYSEYRRPSPPREGSAPAPWRQQENMYPRGGGMGRFAGGGADYMESRRQQRESNTLSIWPPSPKAPARDLSAERDSKHRKKSHKRRHEPDSDTDTDSEEEHRRRRKERKKSRKEKKEREHERPREHRRHRSRSHRRSDEQDSEDERERRRRKDRHRSDTRTKSPEQRPPTTEAEDDEWVEKSAPTGVVAAAQGSASPPKAPPSMPPPARPASQPAMDDEEDEGEDEDDEVGPQLPQRLNNSRSKVDERQYGGALLRGEGSAMAAFLKDGTDMRIPRRGEIGLESDEITAFESVGYVMSGSRHRRMNAVRMRKENQVISAEEKRGILKLQQEERERREAILREEFQQLVDEKLKSQGGPAK
ncbi:ras-induced vulval development antagonist-domain-containing protein [Rhodofomes roseus]|uniref:Ras-induced vulval development antagonist-domain-containing protein n=1 Tax=Rhodofomes roseus TaxID=34475 RepID=A0ABQ8KNC1_9APHY|nr:ras-induced vulval development antagonist-domain-containing protein [Rhodofomes roseus]KAH9839242.1 ras-induced vulval development antagonist-domain-containing protein [Rhodofomes roseus]